MSGLNLLTDHTPLLPGAPTLQKGAHFEHPSTHAMHWSGCSVAVACLCSSLFKGLAAEQLCLWWPAGTAERHPARARSTGLLTPPPLCHVKLSTL